MVGLNKTMHVKLLKLCMLHSKSLIKVIDDNDNEEICSHSSHSKNNKYTYITIKYSYLILLSLPLISNLKKVGCYHSLNFFSCSSFLSFCPYQSLRYAPTGIARNNFCRSIRWESAQSYAIILLDSFVITGPADLLLLDTISLKW